MDGGLDEFHTIGHRNVLREALDDIGRTNASDKRNRPVSVPPRLFAIRDASHVRDAPKTDRFGGLHALFEQPDRVIADFHGASERRQVHENQTVFDRDGVRSAVRSRNERCGVLPFQLACLGYGKLTDWVCDGSGALLATACRTEVSNSDDTVRLNNQHSRGLTVGHAAHAVDFNRRPILSRQNVLALFRIPTASTNRAAELHEYQRSGFDDGEPFAVVQGYGML